MAFSFNFQGDDILESRDGVVGVGGDGVVAGVGGKGVESVKSFGGKGVGGKVDCEEGVPQGGVMVKREDWWGMLSTLPSQISYTTTTIISPTKERITHIPRRALFDVRMQIMSESDDSSDLGGEDALKGQEGQAQKGEEEAQKIGLLGDSDLEQNVYEGGFKQWEGAVDLARLLLERGPRKDIDDLARVDGVVELGCGTALPTLILLQHALSNNLTLDFTLADYNASVLRLVTLPNILLTWALLHSPSSFSPPPTNTTPSDPSNPYANPGTGDLTITPTLLSDFRASLSNQGITLTLLSGPWSPTLTPPLIPLHPSQSLLVLAAETIYSPASLTAFTETLLAVLRRVRLGKAVVAAKRVYFGVGGSVDEFKGRVGEGGGVVWEVENSGVEGCERVRGGGVGRALLEVQMC